MTATKPPPRHDPNEVDVDEAMRRITEHVEPLPPVRLPAQEAVGLVVAEDHHAKWALPTADVSTMDGWAVAVADLQARDDTGDVELQITGESAAGHASAVEHRQGTAQRISTGAVLPVGCDAVVAVEDTTVSDSNTRVCIRASGADATMAGRFVRHAGSDLRTGDRVLRRGAWLDAASFAAAAAAGHDTVLVFRRPTVAIVSTGDELVPIGHTPSRGQTPSTNAAMLAAMLRDEAEVTAQHELADDEALVAETLLGLVGRVDVIVTTGGNSVGAHDHVASVLARATRRAGEDQGNGPDGVMLFRRVAMRPGRPTSATRLGTTWVFALAGNPASTFVGATLFVRPALRRMAGFSDALVEPLMTRLPLASPVRGLETRDDFVRMLVEDGRLVPLPNQASGALSSLAAVDALARVPRGAGMLGEGEPVTCFPLTAAALRAALLAR